MCVLSARWIQSMKPKLWGKTVIRGSVPQRDKEKEQMKQTYNDCYLPIKPMMIFNDYLYSQ